MRCRLPAAVRLATALAVLVAVVGVSSSAATPTGPVSAAEWQPVLSDWLAHGKFTKRYSCAAAVVARTHAPPRYKEGSPLVHALDLYELSICRPTGDAGMVAVGMSNRQVAAIAGVPVPWLSGTHSWAYRTPEAGRRIVFTSLGYVSLVQLVAHG